MDRERERHEERRASERRSIRDGDRRRVIRGVR